MSGAVRPVRRDVAACRDDRDASIGAGRVDRELLDLDARTLAIEDTRVVVAGYTVDSDGKSNAGIRVISLDDYTVKLLRAYVAVLDDERDAFGAGYDTSHSKLMRYPDGRALHADTITRRFNRLVDLAGVRRIRLHDVRHTYRDAVAEQRRPRQDRQRPDRARPRGDHCGDLRAPLDGSGPGSGRVGRRCHTPPSRRHRGDWLRRLVVTDLVTNNAKRPPG